VLGHRDFDGVPMAGWMAGPHRRPRLLLRPSPLSGATFGFYALFLNHLGGRHVSVPVGLPLSGPVLPVCSLFTFLSDTLFDIQIGLCLLFLVFTFQGHFSLLSESAFGLWEPDG
jgi:hypothetical protein